MLFSDLKSDGTLIVRATEQIEEYALRQWEIQHKSGKAKLVIETGQIFDIAGFVKILGKDVIEFSKWHSEQQAKAPMPEVEAFLKGKEGKE